MAAAKKTKGGDAPARADIKGRLGKLAETLPEAPPAPAPKPSVTPFEGHRPRAMKLVGTEKGQKSGPYPVLRTLADVAREDFTWLWHGRIPEDRVSLIMGEPEAGKSTLWTYLAAVITSGLRWPEGRRFTKPGSVLVIQSEEVVSKEVRDRVDKFGGDLLKVHFMDGVVRDGGEMTTVSLAHDVPAIEAALDEFGDVRLVIVDPLGEFIEGISGNNEAEVRRLLRPLRRMAEERKVAVLLMAHMNKDDESDITKRLMGSSAFLGICRMSWFLSQDPFDASRRCLSYLKGNAEEKVVTGLAYGLDAKGVPFWCKDPVKLHARQVDVALRDQRRSTQFIFRSNGPAPTKIQAAMDFVLASIASGPKLQSDVWKEASEAAIRESTFLDAVSRLVGKTGGDDEEDLEAFLVKKKVSPSGKKAKQFWLWPIVMERPDGPLPDFSSEPDPLDVWLDDGGLCAGALDASAESESPRARSL